MIKLAFKLLNVGDVEDPDIYLGAAVWDWLQTEHGKWVKEHASNLTWNQTIDHRSLGYVYKITGTLSEEDAFVYKLQWPNI
jgi:hypothetical protein